MARNLCRYVIAFGLAAAGLLWNGEIHPARMGFLSTAEAIVGAPRTPVSYAGVARRSTVGVGYGGVGGPASGVGVRPGAGAGRAGGPASGVGVRPGAGAGQVGVGYSGGVGVNLGGPVNRVGVR